MFIQKFLENPSIDSYVLGEYINTDGRRMDVREHMT
jgi:hypothetical protein